MHLGVQPLQDHRSVDTHLQRPRSQLLSLLASNHLEPELVVQIAMKNLQLRQLRPVHRVAYARRGGATRFDEIQHDLKYPEHVMGLQTRTWRARPVRVLAQHRSAVAAVLLALLSRCRCFPRLFDSTRTSSVLMASKQ